MSEEIKLIDVSSPKALKETLNNAVEASEQAYNKAVAVEEAFDTKVPKNTTIAGVDLQDNITKNELLAALNVADGAQVNPSFESTATNIKMNGTQSVGSLSTVARADHIHPSDTSKVNKSSDTKKVYATDSNGEQTTLAYETSATANNIVQRDNAGQIIVPETPTMNTFATSKKYVDNGLSTKQDAISSSNKLSADLVEDGTTNKVFTATEQSKLSGIASGAEVNVQSDWNQTDSTADDFIKNKPYIPAGVVIDTTLDATSSNAIANSAVTNEFANKMNKTNPTGTGALSINRKENTRVAAKSVALGNNCEASGIYSYAVGDNTVSNHKSEYVFGEFNEKDQTGVYNARGTYVEIVGNGTDNNNRSNARTLDWQGNEKLSGWLTMNGSIKAVGRDGNASQTVEQTLLDNYYTKSQTDAKLEKTIIQKRFDYDHVVTAGTSEVNLVFGDGTSSVSFYSHGGKCKITGGAFMYQSNGGNHYVELWIDGVAYNIIMTSPTSYNSFHGFDFLTDELSVGSHTIVLKLFTNTGTCTVSESSISRIIFEEV